MVKLSLLTAVAYTFLAGGVAVAKDKADGAPKEKKICTVSKTTTSRIPRKTCRTQAEMDMRSAQDDLDDAVAKLRTTGRVD